MPVLFPNCGLPDNGVHIFDGKACLLYTSSMAMAFLTAPWHHLLFGRDTDKYALLHAEDSFVFLAYGCEVDEFQHIMYQNPDLTPDERNAEWLKLEKKYRPWIDFAGLPFYGRGAGWQRQRCV